MRATIYEKWGRWGVMNFCVFVIIPIYILMYSKIRTWITIYQYTTCGKGGYMYVDIRRYTYILYICIYTYMCIYDRILLYILSYTWVRIYINKCIFTYFHTCTYVCICFIHVYVWMIYIFSKCIDIHNVCTRMKECIRTYTCNIYMYIFKDI